MANISLENLKVIYTLIEKEVIAYSEFKNKKVLNLFVDFNALKISNQRPKTVSLSNIENLFYALTKEFNLRINSKNELSEYIEKLENQTVLSRDEVVKFYTDTKKVPSKSFNGIKLNCFEELEIVKNTKPYLLRPLEGGAYFFFYKEEITIPKDIVIVGVENPQVLWYIHKYKHLFESNKKYIFLLIQDQNSYPLKWLKNIENEYLHFGDFDYAAISIYLNKILPRLSKKVISDYFVPNNISELLKEHGTKELYVKQEMYKNKILETKFENILKLANKIEACKKCLEQEFLVEGGLD